MSYQDFARGGAGASVSDPARHQPNRQAEGLLLKLANNISALKKQVDLLGTPKDTVAHRHRIADINHTIQDLAHQTKDVLSRSHDASAAHPDTQLKHKKLLQDFAALLQDYKSTQKVAQDKEAASLPRPNPTNGGVPGSAPGAAWDVEAAQGRQLEDMSEKQALLQAQKQQQAAALESEMALNEVLIEERDAGIREIVRQIGEVNEMFQDLAVLINDQGVQVRTIEEHVTATAERAKEGTRELVQAQRSNRSYRNKCLWLWLIAALVVSLILILTFA